MAANSLSEALEAFFPASVLSNPGASCKEKRKSISFRKEPGDIVHCLELKEAIKEWKDWPQGTPSCDCLFVCGQEGRDEFLVLFAELKGDDTEKALAQLQATAGVFCKQSSQPFLGAGHGRAGLSAKGCRATHGKVVLAAIVSKSGGRVASSWQDERKRLRNHNIKLLDRQASATELTVSTLFNAANRIR